MGRRFLILAVGCAGVVFGQDAGQNVGQNVVSPSGTYQAISNYGRIQWAIDDTIGIPSLLAGGISAGWGTWRDRPPEDGTHWLGFAKRYGMRMSGIAVQNTMEASLGALWGEDPRYIRDSGEPFRARLRYVVKMTFMAENREGQAMPAYARYAAISGSNFLSNTWRPDSEANTAHAVERIGLGFLGRMGKNAFVEFWPDVKEHVFRFGR
jgi:hypothetical protein